MNITELMKRDRLIPIAWTVFILLLCSIPGDDLPDLSLFQADKIGHFVVFAIFGGLWLWAGRTRPRYGWVVIGGVVYAVFTELYQGWLPWGRTPDPYDALADALGVIAIVGLHAFWYRSHRK